MVLVVDREKKRKYINYFYVVNVMIFCVITIVNLTIKRFHVFFLDVEFIHDIFHIRITIVTLL